MENYEHEDMNGKRTLWIIGGVILVIMIIAIVYGATQKTLNKKNGQDVSNLLLGDQSGVAMTTTPATVKTLDLVNLQTFPYKVQAHVTGDLADACSTPRVQVTESGKVFTLNVQGQKPQDAVCATVITPFDKVVDLPVAGINAGTYTVQLGDLSKTFTLSADNTVKYTGDK